MYKKYIKILLIIILALFILWCIGTYRNLEYGILAPAQHLYIEQVTFQDTTLRVEGHLSDSGYFITRYNVLEDGDSIFLSIYQGTIEGDVEPTPVIDYSFTVPEYINKVYLRGSHETTRELWNRKQGVLVIPDSPVE